MTSRFRSSWRASGPEDVDIEVTDGVLTLSGERKAETEREDEGWMIRESSYGSFERSIALPEGVDPASITADFHDGMLEIHVPKALELSKPKTTKNPSVGSCKIRRRVDMISYVVAVSRHGRAAVEVSRRTDYAIRILLELARFGRRPALRARTRRAAGRPVRVRPRHPARAGRGRARRIAGEARTAGIVLARPADEITPARHRRGDAGRRRRARCARATPSWCDRMGGCAVHGVWREADSMVSEYLG